MENQAQLILENDEIPSVSIGIYKDGKSYTGYYGTMDKGKNNPPDDHSLFELASVTKSFTGLLCAQAVLDGKLSVEDDIRKYLDGDFPNLEFNARPIKIRDLLTHSSGITRDATPVLNNIFSMDASAEEQLAVANYDHTALLDDLRQFKLSRLPGTTYDYTPVVGPELIALVLEKVYGKTYQALLDQFILSKAGMRQTKMSVNGSHLERMVNGYTDEGRTVMPMPLIMAGAGSGLKSTVPDLLRYIKFLLEDNSPVIQEMQRLLFTDEDEDGYGYFWHVDSPEFSHNGGTNGATLWVFIMPQINAGFTVIFNSNGKVSSRMINRIANRIYDDLENYPLKNAYFPLRKEILTDANKGMDFYKELKQLKPMEYNFKDASTLNRIGYDLLREERVEDAISIFQLLVSEFPNDGNPYDSLGEAYLINEEYDLALRNYTKSLALNPKNTNAENMIEEINKALKE